MNVRSRVDRSANVRHASFFALEPVVSGEGSTVLEYYDRIIVGIAGSLIGGVTLGLTTALGLHGGIVLGATVATLFMYDAMIRHPPVNPTDPRVVATAVVWHAILFVFALAAFSG